MKYKINTLYALTTKYASTLQMCNYMQNIIWSMKSVLLEIQTYLPFILVPTLSMNMQIRIIQISSHKIP